jgi:diguanylate cyclase (GGDEF)-like protein
VRVTATPLFDDDDRPLYALGQVEDLSARGDRDAELAVQLDPLTGLLNASALDQALDETVQRAHRTGTGCAVLVAELAGWDELNAEPDGAELADELQLAVARRLRSTLRGGDVISRVGANQFVIIAEEVGPQDADSVARRLAAALVAPEVIGGRQLSIAANMGVSVLTDDLENDEDQSATLLAQARTALSRARGSAGGSHVLYSDYSGGATNKDSSAQALYVHPDWQGRR